MTADTNPAPIPARQRTLTVAEQEVHDWFNDLMMGSYSPDEALQEMLLHLLTPGHPAGNVLRSQEFRNWLMQDRHLMKLPDGSVTFSEAAMVVWEWHRSLLDAGYGLQEAIDVILNRIPIDGMTWKLLSNGNLRNWLVCGDKAPPITKARPDINRKEEHDCEGEGTLAFKAMLGAPGIGQAWECQTCGAGWHKVGNTYSRMDDVDPAALTMGIEDAR